MTLDHDKKYEYLLESTVNDTLNLLTFIFSNENKVNVGLELFENTKERFSVSYEIFDVLDIDFDKVPEIVIEFHGYESTGYEIYSIKSGEIVKVYEVVLHGC